MSYRPDKGFVENFLRRDGRLNRWRYFKRGLVILLIYAVAVTIISIAFSNSPDELSNFGMLLIKIISFAVIAPNFCLTVRRLHDMNQSEQLAYLWVAIDIALMIMLDNRTIIGEPSPAENVLTVINSLMGVYFLLWPGTRGYNKYGADPLE